MTFEIVPMIVEFVPIELSFISNGVDAGCNDHWVTIPDHWETD